MERNIEDRVRDPRYPFDLYDDNDFITEKRMSELRKEMISHLIIGFGIGIMFTVTVAGLIVWAGG